MSTFEDALREQYRNLVAQKDAILAKSTPLREQYDAKWKELTDKMVSELKPIETAMKTAEQGLFDLSNDIAAVARALKGRTGG